MSSVSKVTKVIVGLPANGNTVARHRKALKRAAFIHGGLGTSLAGIATFKFMNKELGCGMLSIAGCLASIYNINAMLNARKDLKPAYDEIVTRAKKIYKK